MSNKKNDGKCDENCLKLNSERSINFALECWQIYVKKNVINMLVLISR